MNQDIVLDPEIEALLKNTKTTKDLLIEIDSLEPLDLNKDPEYVVCLMKGILIEDILKAMKELDMSKTELAKKLEKSKQYVSRILNETANFTLETIAQIACALDMQVQTRMYNKNEVLNITPQNFTIESKISVYNSFYDWKKEENTIDKYIDYKADMVSFPVFDCKKIKIQRCA